MAPAVASQRSPREKRPRARPPARRTACSASCRAELRDGPARGAGDRAPRRPRCEPCTPRTPRTPHSARRWERAPPPRARPARYRSRRSHDTGWPMHRAVMACPPRRSGEPSCGRPRGSDRGACRSSCGSGRAASRSRPASCRRGSGRQGPRSPRRRARAASFSSRSCPMTRSSQAVRRDGTRAWSCRSSKRARLRLVAQEGEASVGDRAIEVRQIHRCIASLVKVDEQEPARCRARPLDSRRFAPLSVGAPGRSARKHPSRLSGTSRRGSSSKRRPRRRCRSARRRSHCGAAVGHPASRSPNTTAMD